MVEMDYSEKVEYLDSFTNRSLLKRLRKISLFDLRSLSRDYRSSYPKKVKQLKDEIMTENDFEHIFEEAKNIVDDILGVNENILKVEWEVTTSGRYYNENSYACYDPLMRRISINPVRVRFPTAAIAAFAHEYAHHVLHSSFFCFMEDYTLFDEGFAFGIERRVGFNASEDQAGLLKRFTIRETCLHLDRTTHLLEMRQPFRNYSDKASAGNSFFAALEKERGPDIYRQILQGEFRW